MQDAVAGTRAMGIPTEECLPSSACTCSQKQSPFSGLGCRYCSSCQAIPVDTKRCRAGLCCLYLVSVARSRCTS
ncbi:hypothetical protein LZ31DRAFT_257198 [Colletotrichum somersetense]|nr:hypothetical protein LZ31DRAFT_257198 [Colletotrichum somersetense]